MASDKANQNILLIAANADKLSSYDTSKNAISTTRFGQPSEGHACAPVNLDGDIYLVYWNRSLLRFGEDGKGSSWTTKKPMLGDHGNLPPAIGLSGLIYVIGDRPNYVKGLIECYDRKKDEWTVIGDLPLKIHSSAFVGLENYIYSFGGSLIDGERTNRAARLSIDTMVWEDLPSMGTARSDALAETCNGLIYVAGGKLTDRTLSKALECYNTTSQQWSMLSPMNIGRAWTVLLGINSCLYAIGGLEEDSAGKDSTIEKYEIDGNEWKIVVKKSGLITRAAIVFGK